MKRNFGEQSPSDQIADVERPKSVGHCPYYTVDNLAARWCVSKRHVQRQIEAGSLKAMRVGRTVRIAAAEVALFEATHSL